MVATMKSAGFFERQNVSWLFDNAKQLHRAGRIRTDVAKLIGGEVAAECAGMNSAAGFGNGAGDLLGLIAARLHHPKRDPFGRAWTDPGHLSELRNQVPQRRWIFRFSHTASPMPVQCQA